MSQIEELQARLTAAMDRISAGVETALAAGAQAAEPDADLATALEEERLVNAQLEERLKALKTRHAAEIEALKAEQSGGGEDDGRIAELEAELAAAKSGAEAQGDQEERLIALDADLQRLRVANDELRKANAALREANEAGVGDPDLINKAMLAELEGLRASQAADAAEVGAVMNKLNSLLSNARNLPEGEEV